MSKDNNGFGPLFGQTPGEDARDEGRARVHDNNLRFCDRVIALIPLLEPGPDFIGEDIRIRAVAALEEQPAHPNAWGAIIHRAVREKLIEDGRAQEDAGQTRARAAVAGLSAVRGDGMRFPPGYCQFCGGRPRSATVSSGNCLGIAIALLIMAVGVVMSVAGLWVIGVPVAICALFIGGKRRKVIRCSGCRAIMAERG